MTVFSQMMYHREEGIIPNGIDKATLFWEEESQGMRGSVSLVPVHRKSVIKHFIFGDAEH